MFDGIYLIVIFVSVLPFVLLKRYIKSLQKDKHRRNIIRLIVVHAVLPVGLLLLVQICFGTPLWVVRAFVPDLFFVIIISAALLLCGGLAKLGLFIKYMNTTTRRCGQ